jgi:hypothetical protein
MKCECEHDVKPRSARQAEDLPSEAASVARVRFCEFWKKLSLTAPNDESTLGARRGETLRNRLKNL